METALRCRVTDEGVLLDILLQAGTANGRELDEALVSSYAVDLDALAAARERLLVFDPRSLSAMAKRQPPQGTSIPEQ
jgi:hypothetical protein